MAFGIFGPELVAGAVDENIFQRRLAYGNGLNLAGKRLDHVSDKTVTVFPLQADLASEYLRIAG